VTPLGKFMLVACGCSEWLGGSWAAWPRTKVEKHNTENASKQMLDARLKDMVRLPISSINDSILPNNATGRIPQSSLFRENNLI
jgi:hypothetical protein